MVRVSAVKDVVSEKRVYELMETSPAELFRVATVVFGEHEEGDEESFSEERVGSAVDFVVAEEFECDESATEFEECVVGEETETTSRCM